MKLVEIKNIRYKQVRQADNGIIYILNNAFYTNDLYIEFKDNLFCKEKKDYKDINFLENNTKIIGFLGITHEIKDNKLIEIPRKEFEVDDIFLDNEILKCILVDNTPQFEGVELDSDYKVLTEDLKEIYDGSILVNSKKIGIYGVTHEFVNDKIIIK